MFNKEEASRVKTVFQQFAEPVEFILPENSENEFGQKLERVVAEIIRLSHGKAGVAAGVPEAGLPAWPCFKIGIYGRANIIYAALPTGREFAPFIRMLEMIARSRRPAEVDESREACPEAEIQVFMSEHCPRCPAIVEAALLLAIRHPWITCCVIDAGQFPQAAEQYGVRSVPAAVLDRTLVLVADISAERLMDLIQIRGTSEFDVEVVRSRIERGRIAEAADSLSSEAGRQLILNFLQHSEFSRRLSALAVCEKALDRNPESVQAMTPSLVELLSHPDARIRGDIADLLGKIGDPRALAGLEPLATDPDPDVAEAAAEAIANLHKQLR